MLSNVLSIGGQIVGKYTAVQMADAFLNASFSVGFSEASPEFLREAYGHVQEIEKELWM